MKKFKLGFTVMILLMETIFIGYLNYSNFVKIQKLASNSLMSDNSITVLFEKQEVPSLHNLINKYPDITILSTVYDYPDMKVFGICGNCNIDNDAYALIEGNFFTKHDFFNGVNKAVVGRNILNSNNCVEDQQGNKHFVFENTKYKIIGVLSSNISNMLDNTVYINLESINNNFRKIIIDDTNCQKAVKEIQKNYDIKTIKENNTHFMERYIFNDHDNFVLNVLVIVFIGLLMILISLFVLHNYSEELSAERIIGIDFKNILFNLLKDITYLITSNIFLAFLIYAVIYLKFLQNLRLKFYFFYFCKFSVLIYVTLCLIIYIYICISNHVFYKNGAK
ncbi:ABC transporter permease [Caproicibacter fermentans]|uniref:ABC transporter permease n=1 Tax=Caproicibacter fermentans TaxID=2576756 RepID=A0A7G8T6V5_9FIRM|nr:ABC transporter permease [Caproicibacter fermentans]QNK39346.1 ABC transporter permease [Caproicibacter fermentans]